MKINYFLTVAALFFATAGSAMAGVVAVDGQAGPWDPTLSGNPDYGVHDNTGPTVVAVTPGATITITYVSGLTSAFGGPPAVDALGYVGGIFGSGVGRSGIGSSGTPLPSFYIDPANVGPDINLNELIGSFVSDTGTVLAGSIFAVGDGPFSIIAPLGAADLELGVNDDIFSDNTGSLLVNVDGGSAVPEPSTWLMMLMGIAGLGFLYRRTSRQNSMA